MKSFLALLSEKDARVNSFSLKSFFLRYKEYIFSFAALTAIFLLFILLYLGAEQYIKTKRVPPLAALRSKVISTINEELGKAVDLGVVDFSLFEGLILEDLVISQEEDFSFNSNLLKVKKVTFHIASYLSTVPQVDRIDFFSPHLVLNNDETLERALLSYFQKTKIKEVVFHNARVSLIQGDRPVLEWKEGWDIRLLRKDGKIFIYYNNGIYWLPNATRVKGEGIISEENLDDFDFAINWKNYPSEEAPLLISYLFGASLQSAVLSGNASWKRNSSSGNILKGDVEYENASFYIPPISGSLMSGLRFKEKFFFQNDNEIRDFSSLDFQVKMEDITSTDKEKLFRRKIDFKLENMEALASSFRELISGEGLRLKGNLRGNLEITESGDKNKWFKTLGTITSEGTEFVSDRFSFHDGSILLNLTSGNNLSLMIKGKVFDKPFNLDLTSQLDWSKSKKLDGSFYYPLSSKSKGNLVADEFTASDWLPLFSAWKKETLVEIKQRQEKLIPEEYFIQRKVYKYFLESMNLDLSLTAKKYFPFTDGPALGEGKGTLIVKDGQMRSTFNLVNSTAKLTITSYFAAKSPNFLLNLQLSQYPWNHSWMEVCGMKLKPELVTLDYSFGSQGSDTYMISKDARINYSVKLENVKWIGKELWMKLDLPEKLNSDLFSVEFKLDHYFDSDYVRELSIISPSVDLKGYAQNKSGDYNYSVYGFIGENRGNYTFTEDESKRCSRK